MDNVNNSSKAPISMAEMKALIKANLGEPKANQNAASTLAGTVFLAEARSDGKFVVATLLPTLSARGKIQAVLHCCTEGCTETHVREQSDWHQAMWCRTHSAAEKVKLTEAEKTARKLAKAKELIAKLEPKPEVTEPVAEV